MQSKAAHKSTGLNFDQHPSTVAAEMLYFQHQTQTHSVGKRSRHAVIHWAYSWESSSFYLSFGDTVAWADRWWILSNAYDWGVVLYVQNVFRLSIRQITSCLISDNGLILRWSNVHKNEHYLLTGLRDYIMSGLEVSLSSLQDCFRREIAN